MDTEGARKVADAGVTRTGEAGTAVAVNPGQSGYFYEFDEWGQGTLWLCPPGQYAYDNSDGTVRCDSRH